MKDATFHFCTKIYAESFKVFTGTGLSELSPKLLILSILLCLVLSPSVSTTESHQPGCRWGPLRLLCCGFITFHFMSLASEAEFSSFEQGHVDSPGPGLADEGGFDEGEFNGVCFQKNTCSAAEPHRSALMKQ